MTTLVARILITALAVTQIPLAGEVFAQEDVEEVSTTSAETSFTEIVPAEENWFETEFIQGNIDVGDFVVGPGRSEISLKPGETATVEITVTNRISSDREFVLEVEDIEGATDGSSMVTVQGRKSPTGIADFVSFPENTFDLELGERARLPVTITVPENTSPGGYFGAVLVSTLRQARSEEDFAPRSPLIARVASLIFLTVEGEVEYEGELVSLDTLNQYRWWYEKGPIELGVLYENTGTVHLNPYGEVSIKNMLGDEVGYLILEPWFVLPQALRNREFSWDREFLFGRYTVEAKINRGYEDIVDTVETSFWVLPWKLLGTIFVVIFIIIFIIRAFFKTFEFKRKE